jgi:alkylation response protein AidB-like acyl-CoA dehydrogenase
MSDDLNLLSNDAFRDRWRSWLRTNYPEEWRIPIIYRLAGDDERRWHRMTYEAGWRAPPWPKEYGGLGISLECVRRCRGTIVPPCWTAVPSCWHLC